MAKLQLEINGFDELVKKLSRFEKSVVRQTTEKALQETHSIVTNQAENAMHRHKRTGKTEASIVTKPKIDWEGQKASVKAGFNIRKGGLPSIFLMYGTPRSKKDQKLYNAFFGSATKKRIHEAQEKVFYEAVRRLDT